MAEVRPRICRRIIDPGRNVLGCRFAGLSLTVRSLQSPT